MDKKMYDLTAPQKSIWLTEQYFTNSNVNNICGTAIVSEILDFDILRKAIIHLIENNDIFRLHFIEENGILKQYFGKNYPHNIELVELNSENEINDLEQKLLSRVFRITEQLYEIKMFKIKNSNKSGCLINIHHILCDAFSAGNICQKALKAYTQLVNGETLTIDNKYSYENYLISEKEYYESQKYVKDKEYWDNMFETVPNIVTIPSKTKDYSENSYYAKRYNYIINKEKMNKIIEFCTNSKISIFNLFMSILSVYMYRITNINDFVIGTPILNRTNFNEKNTLGMFINVVPLRINIDDTASILELFSTIATNSMGLLRHQKYSYQSILENIRKINPAIPNLYNIILSYQITKTTIESNLSYETNWAFNGTTLNDIEIHLYDVNNTGELNIAYDYKVDKYTEQDIIDINKRLNYLIDQILENKNLKIQDLEIATPEERNLILNVFNNTKVDYPSDKTIVELFEEQVELHPDNIAVVFENKKLSYKELNEKANQLANYLLSQNITPRTVIGLRLNKQLEMIIGILAIIKAGCCYLPINLQYPLDRVNYMLKDSNAKVLLCTKESSIETDSNIPLININLENQDIYNFSNQNLNLKISPEDLIYIIYTSGSTGKPKGAMICHRNVVRLFKNDKFLFDFGNNDVWTMFHSVAFDFSVWEMYGALLFGGKLILVPDEIARDPNLFLNLLTQEQVTILNQTPTYFYKLLKTELENNNHNLSLRYIIFGGEALKPNLIKNWYLKYPNTKLINMYGITETTVHVTFKELSLEDLESSSSNIGTPIPTLHVIIVDKNMKLLPFGIEGEMCVLGEGVFKGYLNREDLNKTKLLQIPEYSNIPIYRSGDSAILHPDGHLEYIGRIDNQVKIRGFRIELGEIEEKILSNSNIETCIVTKKTDELDRDLLCAYYIKKGKLDISKLRTDLSKSLPIYMIPQYFIEIDKVPININGKTDFKALPLPNFNQQKAKKKIVKPRNEIESKLIDIYIKFLHVENISITDSFFELGGDSLTAINIAGVINNTFNTNISVKDILEKSIIMDLANYISNLSTNLNLITNDIIATTNQSLYPLSSAQKRIFYTSNMNPELCVYNISGGIEFSQKLDLDKIKNIFEILITRHESFRTYFEIKDNELYQKVLPNFNFEIESKFVSYTSVDNAFKLFNTKFDLNKAPLLKIQVLYLDNNHTMLFINMHHIISDGTSMQILLDEFCKLYNNEELSKKKFTYKDFINFEKYFSGSEKFEDNKKFWLNEFANEIPTLNLPTNYTRPSVFSYNGAKIHNKFNKDIISTLLKTTKELQVTPYMFLLACYYILLYKYTNQNDIIVGTPIANRDIPEFSNIIGMFVNTLAIRKKIHSSQTTFLSFLNEVKEKCLNCFSHQNYPFDELIKELNLQRDISRNPLFDTMFIFQNNTIIKSNTSNTQYYIPDTKISKFDLSLEIMPQDDEFILTLEYCTSLFTKEFIERFSNHYIELVKNTLNNLNSKICDLEILSIQEKNKITNDFNNTKTNYNQNDYIYKLIDKQCCKTPNYTAITFKNNSITYNELLEKSNSLANYLHSIGIGTNSFVGILLPRSLELLVAILAVLKTGACYIPIDPSFPDSRIDYMLNNSGSSLLLTFDNLRKNNIKNLCVEFSNTTLYTNPNLDFTPNTVNSTPAYMIYTSGSTGNPKGVVLTHKSLSNLTNYLNNYVEYLKNDYENMAIASLTTVSFDIFIFETLISMQKGLNVVLASENEQVMPNLLNDLIDKYNIKAFQLTPSRMEILLNNLSLIPNLKNIQFITLAGEPLSNKLLESILEIGKITVYNGYGPSETTVFSTFTDVSNHKNVTIGKPLDNTQIYILDKDNNICPIDVPGELCICGDGVGLGYRNIPSTVKNNFTIHPISKRPMYRTGDLAKYLQNGEIMYIERIDNQVKIRGLRIELDEIENKITEFPNVKKVIVLAKTDNNNRKYLIAYITIKERISINKLREHLRKYLPKYMIPSYFEILTDFPYLPNGKVNKKELPTPNLQANMQEFVPARNSLDKQILEIFQNLLNLSPIGITDNFFELGGDSLLAIRLQVELMKITEGITYADIFLNPTVQELTDKINNLNSIVNSLTDTIELLNCNTYIQNYTNLPGTLPKKEIGNILLTGSTGYLGIHILNEFLENESGKIYCLLRNEKGLTLEQKLLNKLHFYFDNKFDHLLNNRIIIISGDITLENLGLSETDYNQIKNDITTIINCAAKVSHFGRYELYKKINVDGVQHLINFCKKNSKTLYHMSTTSVAGNSFNDSNSDLKIETNIYKENNFFINQTLDNVYTKSKFDAEKLIITELKNGLDAYILRIGNLMGRASDGKFQQNIEENAYVNRLLSFIRMRHVPDYLLDHSLEFTPVDYCSKAIINLLTHSNNDNRIFHLLNDNRIVIRDLLNIFEQNYFKIVPLPISEFKELITNLLKNNQHIGYLNGIISDFDKDQNFDYILKILTSSDFTKNYLNLTNFSWPSIDSNYISKFFKYLNNLYKF